MRFNLVGDRERGHVFTDRVDPNARGVFETMFAAKPPHSPKVLLPDAKFEFPAIGFHALYALGQKLSTRLPRRNAVAVSEMADVIRIV